MKKRILFSGLLIIVLLASVVLINTRYMQRPEMQAAYQWQQQLYHHHK